MNLIGIFVPNIIIFLGIWLPDYSLHCKFMLSAICLCMLLCDFDRSKPGHKGLVYRVTSLFSIGVQEILICTIGLSISLIFEIASVYNCAWIPAFLCLFSMVFRLYELVTSVKDLLSGKKRKSVPPAFYSTQQNSAQQSVPPAARMFPIQEKYPGHQAPFAKIPCAIMPIATLKKDFQKENNKYYKKRFSILGDSISTLEGFNPAGYNVFYTGDNCIKAVVSKYEDTWWGHLIDFFGGELLVNNSWSGSRVSILPDSTAGTMFPSGCSNERTGGLHRGEDFPDVVIISLGINDWANGVSLDIPLNDRHLNGNQPTNLRYFGSAYGYMLHCIRNNYPNAEIWCCTLSTTRMSSNSNFRFPRNLDNYGHFMSGDIVNYNEIIKENAQRYSCKLIDLFDCMVPYDTIDGIHPNAKGMKEIAEVFLSCLAASNTEIHTTFISPSDFEGVLLASKYRILRCISASSMTGTYLAEAIQEDGFFTISVVDSSCPLSDTLDSFEEAFHLKSLLSHPAIPKAVDLIKLENFSCFVSEYLQGRTLDDVLKENKVIDLATLLDWTLQLCDVLAYLHSQEKPIILRNLCPSNILLQPDGKLRLAHIESNLTTIGSTSTFPTPGFSAPESFAGKSDIRADIFSMGMILCSLALGVDPSKPPYIVGSIRENRPDLPYWFEKIVDKCIQAKPQKRFQNCNEVMLYIRKHYTAN